MAEAEQEGTQALMLSAPHPEIFLDGRVTLHGGDCLDVLARLEEGSVDSCVTDPPYHLTSIVKRFGGEDRKKWETNGQGGGTASPYQRTSVGFMGKQWDGGDIAFRPETWAAVYRVMKPGAHLLAFSGTRTYHRMACAIEDAGFEIRDCIQWLYGSGFPKSHNAGNGWGTALKPACEPIVLARKPLIGTVAANVLAHGTGALNIDGCRVDADARPVMVRTQTIVGANCMSGKSTGATASGEITTLGRWPANVIHDGSYEVVAAFPDVHGAGSAGYDKDRAEYDASSYQATNGKMFRIGDAGGSAARFFYTSKADSDDRLGSKHPTVKPLDLMQYLVRLICPKNGLVLDPFSGTGTTGEAAWREGMRAVLIEREAEYQNDIRRRMELATAGPDERVREGIRAAGRTESVDDLPLFGGLGADPPTAGRQIYGVFADETKPRRK